MKLPFDIDLKLIFRVLLPGIVVSLALLPLLGPILSALNAGAYADGVFIALALVGGWVVLILDMPIYMVYEGRRYWPKRLREKFVGLEKKRLSNLLEINQKYRHNDPSVSFNDYKEAWVDIRRFPLDEHGDPEARFPTRLGNLIASYEDYPDSRYNIDSIFLWPLIWINLDKDLRAALDDSQAQADSSLYTSFALYFLGLMYFVYLLLKLIGVAGIGWVDSASGLWVGAIALLGFAGGYGLYLLDLNPQASYGDRFKATFDQHLSKIDFTNVLDLVTELTGDEALKTASWDARADSFWLYLQYFKVKKPGTGEVISVPEYKKQLQKEKDERKVPSVISQPPPHP